MKREDVLDAAKKCGFFFHDAGYAPILHTLPREYSERMFERLVNLVEKATLERAAKIAETCDLHEGDYLRNSDPRKTIAHEIRADMYD